ncbi:unnamed protein product, partial [Aphanomyces euteiches]
MINVPPSLPHSQQTSTTMTRASTSSAAIFNLTLNSALDATSPSANYNNGKAECLAWLAALRVTDAYRLKYPSTRVFSGPGRRNRLDYIFVDWGLATHHLHNSIYEANRYRGDHLTHTTTLATVIPTTPSKKRPSSWRLPRELLLNPHTVKAIKCEAQSLLDDFLEEPECNAGAKWLGWLRRMKRKMKQGQFNRQRHRQELLTIPRRCYVKAKSDLRAGLVEPEVFQTTRDRYTDAKAEQRQSSLDRG